MKKVPKDPMKRNLPFEIQVNDLSDWIALPFERIDNFRDVSSIINLSGQYLKSGMLFRSGTLSEATKNDILYMKRLTIRSIADFRGSDETSSKPDKFPANLSYFHFPIEPGGKNAEKTIRQYVKGKVDFNLVEFMEEISKDFVLRYTPTFRRWIHEILLKEQFYPHVFHCNAGKDRTGFASALILKIIGVPEQVIIQDYLASNKYFEPARKRIERKIRFYTFFRKKGDEILPLLEVRKQYLATAFFTIDQEWGSFDLYVKASNGLNLSEEQISWLNKTLRKAVN